MPKESPIPSDYVKLNQEHWINAKRGRFSRPLNMTRTADFLHKRMVDTFSLEGAQKHILTLSIFFDKPKTPSSRFVYEERFPDEVREEDKKDFSIGIERITEYATNMATIDFINKNAKLPFVNLAAAAYAKFGDLATYGILINGTYREMSRIAWIAERNGKDFKKAMYNGLFNHDTEPIDELIADTEEFSGCSNINDLAIKLGRKRFKKLDIGKWLGKLEIERTDGPVKANIKNCMVSVLAGGVFRSPGVTEVSAGVLPIFFLETAAIYTAHGNFDLHLLAENLAVVTITGFAINPFAAIHEMTHGLSSSKNNMGFIPARLIEKEVTPYFTRLETEE